MPSKRMTKAEVKQLEDLTSSANRQVDAAMQKLGYDIKDGSFENWLGESGVEDMEEFNMFDSYVRLLLGHEAFEELEWRARLVDGLLWKLGMGPAKCGGIDVSKIIGGKPVKKYKPLIQNE